MLKQGENQNHLFILVILNLERRLKQHRYKKRIKNIQLIWFEIFDNKTDAFNRERNFKR